MSVRAGQAANEDAACVQPVAPAAVQKKQTVTLHRLVEFVEEFAAAAAKRDGVRIGVSKGNIGAPKSVSRELQVSLVSQLMACFNQMRLTLEDRTLYRRLARQTEDLKQVQLFAFFITAGIRIHAATVAAAAAPEDSVAPAAAAQVSLVPEGSMAFFVCLTGELILNIDGQRTSLVSGDALLVEAENQIFCDAGSWAVAWGYTLSSELNLTGKRYSAAKKYAAELQNAARALRRASTKLRNLTAFRKRKAETVEEAAVEPGATAAGEAVATAATDLVATAASDPAATAASDPSATAAGDAAATKAGHPAATAAKQPVPIAAFEHVATAASSGNKGFWTHSWHEGPVVHRGVVVGATAFPFTDIAKASLASFEQGIQFFWYFADQATLLAEILQFVATVANVTLRELSPIMSRAERDSLIGSHHPPQHIKDIVSFRIVNDFGGFWADLDILAVHWLALPKQIPEDVHTVFFFEFERTSGYFVKSSLIQWKQAATPAPSEFFVAPAASSSSSSTAATKHAATAAFEPATLNIVFFWARRKNTFLQAMLLDWERFRHQHPRAWRGDIQNPRGHPQWCGHQLTVQRAALRWSSVLVMPPLVGHAFPRWLPKSSSIEADSRRESFGTLLPSYKDVATAAYVINLWDGVWSSRLSSDILQWWRGIRKPQAQAQEEVAAAAARDDGFVQLRQLLTEKIVDALPCMLTWGLPVATIMKVQSQALDFVAKIDANFAATAAGDCEEKRVAVVLATLLQASAKMHWLDTYSVGGVSSLDYYCRCLHHHFGLEGSDFSILKLDQLYVNHIAAKEFSS